MDITVEDPCCSQDGTLKRLTREPILKYNGQLVYWEHQDIFSTLPWNQKCIMTNGLECNRGPLNQHTLQPSTGMKTCFHIRCAIARSCQNQRTASIIAIAKHISYGPHCPCKAQKRYISMYIYDIWYITSIYIYIYIYKRVGPVWHNCNCLWAWCEPCRYNPPIYIYIYIYICCSFAIGEQKQGQIAIVLQRLMLWAILFKGLFIVQRCRLG